MYIIATIHKAKKKKEKHKACSYHI